MQKCVQKHKRKVVKQPVKTLGQKETESKKKKDNKK